MPFSHQPLAFKDVIGAMDKALEFGGGMVPCKNEGAATLLRHRMNSARSQDRRRSTQIYPEGHPMYGQSPYDQLVMRLREIDGVWHVIMEKSTEDSILVVPLPST